MNDLTVTIRPRRRTEITNLPWEGRGAGYDILGKMIGATKNGQVKLAGRAFSVARLHTNEVIYGLAERYGRVKVIQHGGLDRCVEACWKKGKPETVWECECFCAGANHGSGSPYKVAAGSGGAGGELSVQASEPRVFYFPG